MALTSAPVAAVEPLLLPVDSGSNWCIWQGYNSGTHNSAGRYSLDLTYGSCNATSSIGRTVRAPAAGTAVPFRDHLGSAFVGVCITFSDRSGSIKLGHITPTNTAQHTVTAGQIVGTVNEYDNDNGSGVSHLHTEIYSGAYCAAPGVTFSGSNAFACNRDLASPGDASGGNGEWSGLILTSGCSTPTRAAPALVYDDGDGTARIYRWSSTGSAFNNMKVLETGPFDLTAVGGRIATGNFDGAGAQDIVMAQQNPNGTFSFQVFLDGIQAPRAWFTSGPFHLGPVGSRLVAGNFNGSGPDDVALVYDDRDGTMRIFSWLSTGSAFGSMRTYTSGPFNLANVDDRIAVGNFDGAGGDDIVMAHQNPDDRFGYHVFTNALNWDGIYYTSGPFHLGPVGSRLVAGNFNASGPDDVAMVYDDRDGTMRIFSWLSTGSAFGSMRTYTSGPFNLANVDDRIAVGNADGAGGDDIIMAHQNPDGRFGYHVFTNALNWDGIYYTSGPFGLGPVGDRMVVGAW